MVLAKDIMTREVLTVKPDAAVEEVARLMLDHHLGAIPVVDAHDRPLGIVNQEHLITRWSAPIHLLFRLAAEDPLRVLQEAREEMSRAAGKTAADEMLVDIDVVAEDAPLDELVGIFLNRHQPAILVAREGRLVGVVTKRDILRSMGPGAGSQGA